MAGGFGHPKDGRSGKDTLLERLEQPLGRLASEVVTRAERTATARDAAARAGERRPWYAVIAALVATITIAALSWHYGEVTRGVALPTALALQLGTVAGLATVLITAAICRGPARRTALRWSVAAAGAWQLGAATASAVAIADRWGNGAPPAAATLALTGLGWWALLVAAGMYAPLGPADKLSTLVTRHLMRAARIGAASLVVAAALVWRRGDAALAWLPGDVARWADLGAALAATGWAAGAGAWLIWRVVRLTPGAAADEQPAGRPLPLNVYTLLMVAGGTAFANQAPDLIRSTGLVNTIAKALLGASPDPARLVALADQITMVALIGFLSAWAGCGLWHALGGAMPRRRTVVALLLVAAGGFAALPLAPALPVPLALLLILLCQGAIGLALPVAFVIKPATLRGRPGLQEVNTRVQALMAMLTGALVFAVSIAAQVLPDRWRLWGALGTAALVAVGLAAGYAAWRKGFPAHERPDPHRPRLRTLLRRPNLLLTVTAFGAMFFAGSAVWGAILRRGGVSGLDLGPLELVLFGFLARMAAGATQRFWRRRAHMGSRRVALEGLLVTGVAVALSAVAWFADQGVYYVLGFTALCLVEAAIIATGGALHSVFQDRTPGEAASEPVLKTLFNLEWRYPLMFLGGVMVSSSTAMPWAWIIAELVLGYGVLAIWLVTRRRGEQVDGRPVAGTVHVYQHTVAATNCRTVVVDIGGKLVGAPLYAGDRIVLGGVVKAVENPIAALPFGGRVMANGDVRLALNERVVSAADVPSPVRDEFWRAGVLLADTEPIAHHAIRGLRRFAADDAPALRARFEHLVVHGSAAELVAVRGRLGELRGAFPWIEPQRASLQFDDDGNVVVAVAGLLAPEEAQRLVDAVQAGSYTPVKVIAMGGAEYVATT